MRDIFAQFSWTSAIDILVITIIIYRVLILIRGTRAAQMLSGMLFLVALFLLSSIIPLNTINWMLSKFYSSLIIIIIILFQDDIRHVLSSVGKKPLLSGENSLVSRSIIEEVIQSVFTLAPKKIGGLIVFERNIVLSRYVDIGVALGGRVSKEILVSIFNPGSPIHDGAVIIQKGTIAACGCFLPLTKEENLEQYMGTRHRAAIGISQETDAVVVIVSEESASVKVVADGFVSPKLTPNELRDILKHYFIKDLAARETQKSKYFTRLLARFKKTTHKGTASVD